MKHTTMIWIGLGFALGMIVGCTTVAAVAHAPAPDATPRVISAAQATVRHAPNGKALATLYATGEEAYFGRLELAPNASVPEHRDPTEEFIYVLQGTGTVTINDKAHPVAPETLIYMPAHAKVSFQNGDQRLIALQVFANPGPEKKYDKWSPTKP